MTDLQKKENTSKQVAATFALNTKVDVLLVTPDGNCFLETSKNAAEFHANKTAQKLETVNRKDFKKEIEAYKADSEKEASDLATKAEAKAKEASELAIKADAEAKEAEKLAIKEAKAKEKEAKTDLDK